MAFKYILHNFFATYSFCYCQKLLWLLEYFCFSPERHVKLFYSGTQPYLLVKAYWSCIKNQTQAQAIIIEQTGILSY